MFQPVVAIITFYHSTHLKLFYTIRVAATGIVQNNLK